MEDVGSWVKPSYLVSSQTEFEAKLAKCEDSMRSLAQPDNNDGFIETLLRLPAFLQFNPSFELPDTFIGE